MRNKCSGDYPALFRHFAAADPPLNASASAQLCPENTKLVAYLHELKATVVDLRGEAHAFIDDRPVSWYCPGNWEELPAGQVSHIEETRVVLLRASAAVELHEETKCFDDCQARTGELHFFSKAETERAFVTARGLGYARFPVADHQRPPDDVIDAFVSFIESADGRPWLHFHCKGGKGRTTTFLLMYDMLTNGHLSFDRLIERHRPHHDILEGADKKPHWKSDHARKRLAFLHAFYAFSRERHGGQTWSEWSWRRGSPLDAIVAWLRNKLVAAA